MIQENDRHREKAYFMRFIKDQKSGIIRGAKQYKRQYAAYKALIL